MRVYLVQHGTPVPKEKNPDRPLSERGRYDVERAAAFLQKAGVRVGAVYHSGKTRAEQTAEILAERLCAAGDAFQRKGLAPLDDVEDIAQYIAELEDDLMIAGHLPHLGKLASRLVSGSPEGHVVGFQQGGVCCLAKDDAGGWYVVWMIVPEIGCVCRFRQLRRALHRMGGMGPPHDRGAGRSYRFNFLICSKKTRDL